MYSKFDFSLDDKLVNEFDEENLKTFLRNLSRQAENFLRNTKMPPLVYLNRMIYAHCCRNIIAELVRFGNIQTLTSDDKVTLNSYTATWWIRRKPFQLRDNCSPEYWYVNETFAATLFFQASKFYDKNIGHYTVDADKLTEVAAPLMNYLKFQNIKPQSLELFLKGSLV